MTDINSSIKSIQDIITKFNQYTDRYELYLIDVAKDFVVFRVKIVGSDIATIEINYDTITKTYRVFYFLEDKLIYRYDIEYEEILKYNLQNISDFDLIIKICDSIVRQYN